MADILGRRRTRRSQAGSLRVLYVGVILPDYPRYMRLRRYFESEFGAEVDVLHSDDDPGYARKALALLSSGLRRPRGYDAVVLAEFNVKYAWVTWLLARHHGAVHLVDWFVGIHETRVGDWGGGGSPWRHTAYKFLDWLAVRSGDIVVVDTSVRAALVAPHARRGVKPIVLPVGAPSWARPQTPASKGAPLLYYGSFLPLHGVDSVLRALATPQAAALRLTLIGDGNLRLEMEKLAWDLGVGDRCTWVDPVPEGELLGHIAASSAVLGIFGHSEKAQAVIANKVWQGLACERLVLTRRSPALAEIEPLGRGLLVQVEDGQLAEALADPERYGGERSNAGAVIGLDVVLEDYVQSRYAVLGQRLRSFPRWGNR